MPQHPPENADPPDQPIPLKAVGKLSDWAGKARHYPIFSPTWFKLRVRGFVAPTLVLLVVLTIPAFLEDATLNIIDLKLALVLTGLSIVLVLLLGRWLAVKARSHALQRQWTRKQEQLAIALALLIGLGVAAIPVIYTNSINHANRQRLLAPKTAALNNMLPKVKLNDGDQVLEAVFNAALVGVLYFWWGGGLDYLAYLRQRRAIADALRQEELERYKSERNVAEMRLAVLASQVEPHFLFNTLSGVRAAMQSDPARGIAMIDHLVDYLRSTIPQMRSDGSSSLTDVRGQFDSVRAYLGVIHARMPRLDYAVDSAPDLLDAQVPPLMLISLVENAVKHGIEPKKGPARITVSARRAQAGGDEKLELCVTDDGVGFGGASSGSGIGLANIRERLAQLYGKDASLNLAAGAGGGVEASIFLPIAGQRGDNA